MSLQNSHGSIFGNRMDTVGAKTLEKKGKQKKEAISCLPEFSELHLSFETSTVKQFGLVNPKKRQEIKQEIVGESEEKKDVKMEEDKIEETDSIDDLLHPDPEEYNRLKQKMKRPLISMLRYTQTQGEISRDLDRFINKRVEADLEYDTGGKRQVKAESFDFLSTQPLHLSQGLDNDIMDDSLHRRKVTKKLESQIEKLRERKIVKPKKRVVKEFERI